MAKSYDEWHSKQKAAQRRSAQLLYWTRRDTALAAYGDVCAECGNEMPDELKIVPTHGHRWGVSKTGKPIAGGRDKLAWLDKNGYPPGFQLLCRKGCPTNLV